MQLGSANGGDRYAKREIGKELTFLGSFAADDGVQ